MDNFDVPIIFSKKLLIQKIITPKLLIDAELDKEAYGNGSEVLYTAEIKDLKNTPLRNADGDLDITIAGEVYKSFPFKTDNEGKMEVRFLLPDGLISNNALANLKVPYQGQVVSKVKPIPLVLDNIDLQFLPEGGQSIANFRNKIAFKALNEFGKPADVKGIILDEEMNVVDSFASYHDGMGHVLLKSSEKQKYFAKITAPFKSEKIYELPLSRYEGVGLEVSGNHKDSIAFFIKSNEDRSGGLKITDVMNTVLYEQKINIYKRRRSSQNSNCKVDKWDC